MPAMVFLRRVFKEPVVQFLCVGGVLFGAYVFFAEPEETPRETILISQARVQSLADFFQTLRNRAPTAEDMDGLIDDYVAEEVLYREAIKLGLDKDDLVVRRRMRQKLELMLVDMTRGVQPDEERLKDFFDANRENYVSPVRLSFRHVYLGQEPEASDAQDWAELLRRLNADRGADWTTLGASSLLPAQIERETAARVNGTFGEGFASQLLESRPGEWIGPVLSAFGAHAVVVDARQSGQVPRFDDVRDQVLRDFKAAELATIQNEVVERLKKDYTISIERPSR
ncbi:peptidyl-prolyl cis-trans isomerase [Stappia sp.]|uniref:peptidylprolyl isomerase n=1 Tax=Stappia sp. TaxID=1870903 RepID=UPI003C79D558